MERDPYDIHFLQPADVMFSRGPGGVLQGVIEGALYDEILVYRTFPFKYTSQYISIRNAKEMNSELLRI